MSRTTSDAIRVPLRPDLLGPTYVLAVFSIRGEWAVLARSTVSARLDVLGEVLTSVTGTACKVLKVDCDPEDIDAICAAVSELPLSDVGASFDHLEPFFTKRGRS
jgi:hypothetical protein